MAGAVEHKDVVLGLLGVSAGLSGLVLVFLGLVISTYQSFESPTPKPILDRYRRVVSVILAAFAVGILCVILATVWLLRLGHNDGLYIAMAWTFAAQVAALVASTGWTVRQLVWS